MARSVSFRPDDELHEAIEAELDEAEEESGYRPARSKVIKTALRDYFGLDENGTPPEKGAA